MSADQISRVITPRVPTGIWELDYALGGAGGSWGLPIGRFTLSYGEPQTGKSTIYAMGVAQAQRMCWSCFNKVELVPGKVESFDPNTGLSKIVDSMVVGECECGNPRNVQVGWIDVENKWDAYWVQSHGVFEERLMLIKPVYAEQAIDIAERMLSHGMDIIVMDSIAQLSPAKEVDAPVAEAIDQVGLRARTIGTAVRQWNAGMQARGQKYLAEGGTYDVPTFWLVNQVREKIGVSYGSPETTPGGKAVGFATVVEIRTNKGKSTPSAPRGYKVNSKTGEIEWVELGAKVVKNQTAAAMRTALYRICLQDATPYHFGQVLDHDTVLYHALRLEVVKQVSEHIFEFAGERYTYQKSLLEHWAYNPEVFEMVKELTLRLALDRPDRKPLR